MVHLLEVSSKLYGLVICSVYLNMHLSFHLFKISYTHNGSRTVYTHKKFKEYTKLIKQIYLDRLFSIKMKLGRALLDSKFLSLIIMVEVFLILFFSPLYQLQSD